MLKGELKATTASGQKLWDFGALPSGDEGVRLTVQLMSQYARRDASDAQIRKLARGFLKEKTDRSRLLAAFNWIVSNVKYTSDGHDEYVRSPRHTITTDFEGDCDDLATLFASLALAMGCEVWFKVIAWRPENAPANPFTHVYNLVLIRDENLVVPVDAVMQSQGFANEKTPVLRSRIYAVK